MFIRIASINTLGMPFAHAPISARYPALCRLLEAEQADVINAQEVITYRHLALLKRALPSFKHVSYRGGLLGPKGGLVTFARTPIKTVRYVPYRAALRSLPARDIPLRTLHHSLRMGTLVSELNEPKTVIVNTHPTPNLDGDWSPDNRFYLIQKTQIVQLAHLAEQLSQVSDRIVLSGDFNVSKHSDHYQEFVDQSGFTDVFHSDDSPTFHKEFLPSARPAHRIDFIFIGGKGLSEYSNRKAILGEKAMLDNGTFHYVSDHVGLSVNLSVAV